MLLCLGQEMETVWQYRVCVGLLEMLEMFPFLVISR